MVFSFQFTFLLHLVNSTSFAPSVYVSFASGSKNSSTSVHLNFSKKNTKRCDEKRCKRGKKKKNRTAKNWRKCGSNFIINSYSNFHNDATRWRHIQAMHNTELWKQWATMTQCRVDPRFCVVSVSFFFSQCFLFISHSLIVAHFVFVDCFPWKSVAGKVFFFLFPFIFVCIFFFIFL